MIGDDEIKPQRAYLWKGGTVVVILGIGISDKSEKKVIIYKDCLNTESDYPFVTSITEFANHASVINNKREVLRIRDAQVEAEERARVLAQQEADGVISDLEQTVLEE